MVTGIEVLVFLTAAGALSAALTKLLQDLRKERLRKNNAASKFFAEVADALAKIANELRQKRVPRIDGSYLNKRLQNFDEHTRGIHGDKMPRTAQATLLACAKAAKELDAWVLDGKELEEPQREHLFALLERTAGTCRSLSDDLREDA